MQIFFLFCAAMGVMQFVENIKLLYQKGNQLLLDSSFALLEFIWLLVVITYNYQNELPFYGVLAVYIFIAYHVFGWLVAIKSYNTSEENESDTIVIPLWYFKISALIAAIFSFVSYLAYTS